MDLSKLEANEVAAAEAVATFEAEWAAVDAEWRARRRAVNDEYRDAACALEAARRTEAAGEAQVVSPDGVGVGADGGKVG